jgi:hypothetical protein
MSGPLQYKWFFESTTPVEGHMHAIARTISTRQTKFQFMEIMETLSYGKCLVLDGRIQSSQADEFIYQTLGSAHGHKPTNHQGGAIRNEAYSILKMYRFHCYSASVPSLGSVGRRLTSGAMKQQF